MAIKAIILDVYGVLITNAADIAFDQLGGDHSKYGEEIKNLYRAYDLGYLTFEEEHSQIAQMLGVSYQEWVEVMQSATHYNKPLIDYLNDLPLKRAIMSNIGQESLADMKQGLDLSKIDEMIISSEVGFVKPDPRIYQVALERLGVEPVDCLFVDDSQINVDGALQLGLQAVLYTNNSELRKSIQNLL